MKDEHVGSETAVRCSGGEELHDAIGHAAVHEATQATLLHDLNNVLVAILLNAQIVDLRLPAYSQLRRNVHEIVRGAQRGGVLVGRLRANLEKSAGACQNEAKAADMGVGSLHAEDWRTANAERLQAAPEAMCESSSKANRLTLSCDDCTCGHFPKKENRDGF